MMAKAGPRNRDFPRSPALASLEASPVHVIVAEYPELLFRLWQAGVDPAERGGEPLGRVVGDRQVVRTLLRVLAWRDRSPRRV